jgi:hypothetical protein
MKLVVCGIEQNFVALAASPAMLLAALLHCFFVFTSIFKVVTVFVA